MWRLYPLPVDVAVITQLPWQHVMLHHMTWYLYSVPSEKWCFSTMRWMAVSTRQECKSAMLGQQVDIVGRRVILLQEVLPLSCKSYILVRGIIFQRKKSYWMTNEISIFMITLLFDLCYEVFTYKMLYHTSHLLLILQHRTNMILFNDLLLFSGQLGSLLSILYYGEYWLSMEHNI